jgi:CHAD domain-containing protein
MAYCFQPEEAIESAVRRLAAERARNMVSWLDSLEKPEALCEIRKEIKKYRAVLRLFQGHLGKRVFGGEMRLLRHAARGLAEARDAWARVQVFEVLAEKARLTGKRTDPLLQKLRERAQKRAVDLQQLKTVRGLRTTFSTLKQHAAHYRIDEENWDAIRPGLRRSYSCGRKAYEAAMEAPSASNLHAWRRRVKDLWYHCRLLTPARSAYLGPVCSTLKQLSRILGEDHDLVLLDQKLRKLPRRKERRPWKTLVKQRRKVLCQTAFSLGDRLFSEKPSAFIRRMEGFWMAWQRSAALASSRSSVMPGRSGRRLDKTAARS